MPVKMQNQVGNIVISEQAIATVAGSAVNGCADTVGIPSKRISEGFKDILGGGIVNKGIKVYCQDNRITVDVHIVIEYGCKISEAAGEIISAVKDKVEEIVGFEVDKVNVSVEGIKLEK